MTMKSLLPRKWRREIEQPMISFQREMSRLMDTFFGPGEFPLMGQGWAPRVDVSETATDVVVKAEVPGLSKDEIKVTVSGNMLTISGEKKDEREEAKANYTLVERRYGRFCRSITLPSGIDPDKAQADFRDGVLSITLPKTEETRAKKIPVKGEKEMAHTA